MTDRAECSDVVIAPFIDEVLDAPVPDTYSECGNALVDVGEQCDDGNTRSDDGCSEDCQSVETGFVCSPGVCEPFCGDGVLANLELDGTHCDDGNPYAGDGCSERCVLEPDFQCPAVGLPCKSLAVCGDGDLYPTEACDPTVPPHRLFCNADCSLHRGYVCDHLECHAICSDGVLVGEEECDDADLEEGDGCDSRCRLEAGASCEFDAGACGFAVCGDGAIAETERCDDGNLIDGDGCDSTCGFELDCVRADDLDGATCRSVCGDGWVDPELEQCDDGNAALGDGCDFDCHQEAGFACDISEVAPDASIIEPSDAGPVFAPPFMRSRCSTVCGDGIWTLAEVCDDGDDNADEYGACATDCRSFPRCGDGVVNGVEACDNGVNMDRYMRSDESCARGCVLPSFCGNGVVDAEFEEACDWGELNDNVRYSGCTTNCTLGRRCGDGVADADLNEDGQRYEECDDGNWANNDGCSSGCKRERRRVP